MITLNKVNKYYNKGKKNQIHVINNVSLTLEDNGLVVLLGPSGCGKTTMLNCIGGLDRIKKGKIYIDNKKISSSCSRKVDKLRNINIGYIFQDYKLVENLTVYDNVALVLKMLGIKDKKEIDNRVSYVLERVGMYKYRKRLAKMLSGGERQRVGIARAIVKDPDIILADEPTGNLDSKNSLEVMKIIKAISKNHLVILVTHEQNLAKFYATRIIEVQDGQIVKDYPNKDFNTLDYEIDNNFYLKDLENKTIKKDNIDINFYSNDKGKIKLDIVLKNNNIYIRSNTTKKVEVVDDDSSIEFINDHYKQLDKKDIEALEFDFSDVIDSTHKKKYSSILNPFSMIMKGFASVFSFPLLKKLLLIGFFLSGLFVMYSVSSISATLDIKDEYFVEMNKNYLYAKGVRIDVNKFIEYENMPNINYVLPGDSLVGFDFVINDYYQTATNSFNIKGSLSSLNMIRQEDIIIGTYPTNEYEIVVDKLTIDKTLRANEFMKMSGLKDEKDFIGRELKLSDILTFKIVGITDLKSPSIYMYNSMFVNSMALKSSDEEDMIQDYELRDYNLYINKLVLKKGRLPENDYEIIVNYDNQYDMPLNKNIKAKVNKNKLKVVGYYTSKESYNYYFTNSNTIKYKLITDNKGLVISSNNNEEILNVLGQIGLKDSYESSKESYKKEVAENNKNTLLIAGIMLVISLIEIVLMIRSSFLSRIKEIGILRAIGVKKSDIYKMFYGEIFAITTIASLPGILFMAYSLKELGTIDLISRMFLITPLNVGLSIVFIYIFNSFIGLLPVFNVLRHVPARILSRSDLD